MQDEEDNGCSLGQREEPVSPGAVEQFNQNTCEAHVYNGAIDTQSPVCMEVCKLN